MYFPYIRGKMYDLTAIAELSPEIALSGTIIPIIEPVNIDAATQNKISLFAETGMPFLLITNPLVGKMVNKCNGIKQYLFEQYLIECDTCTPAFIVNNRTSIRDIENFFSAYPEHDIAVIYDVEPTDDDIISSLLNNTDITYHVFFDFRTKRQFRNSVPHDKKVLVGDYFEKQDRNADYPIQSEFSDRYLTTPNDDYAHFGDFSIIGRAFSESGGPAYAVALHHMYARDDRGGTLWVKHFVSDRTDTPRDPGGKFLEALAKLIGALPSLGTQNQTAVDTEYQEFYAASHYPGLGVAKKLAVKHHMSLMIKLL